MSRHADTYATSTGRINIGHKEIVLCNGTKVKGYPHLFLAIVVLNYICYILCFCFFFSYITIDIHSRANAYSVLRQLTFKNMIKVGKAKKYSKVNECVKNCAGRKVIICSNVAHSD